MKLDDPELLRKTVSASIITSGTQEPYVFKSLYCRNGYHHRCKLASCCCDCHAQASQQLVDQLMKEKGAELVPARRYPKCTTSDCENRVLVTNDLFCFECSTGNLPRKRNIDARPL